MPSDTTRAYMFVWKSLIIAMNLGGGMIFSKNAPKHIPITVYSNFNDTNEYYEGNV